ncbi:hypothetical protein [Edaphobacter modestus]|uniref:Helicase ATP-binding domain-containing protein n=1 Tax=Edaphobacter modestus TaxID=388466 RepID=A0A4V2G1E1_9BACT|nr:hypothetical protein [Edaphobacter modestus]RZU28906.1 hypothetical protein BDD14_6489 [Edaphobacter modestus]
MSEVLFDEVDLLPLVVGKEGFPAEERPLESLCGFLVVVGKARERDGLLVQSCICGCSRRQCGEEADVDVRYLNDPSNFSSDVCAFQGRAFFPPFAELQAVATRRGIKNTAQYREAFTRGYLPKCSPKDPIEYAEWTSWADFTGDADYFSDSELYNGLIALDLESLGLLPRPERRRFLLVSRYWKSIKEKAKELGIEEKDIPDRMAEIATAISGQTPDDDGGTSKDGNGGGQGRGGGKAKTPGRLTLSEEACTLVNSVTLWLPSAHELQQEIINGFYHHVWEMLDREDTLKGNGIEAVEANVLARLSDLKPELVSEFRRQYEGVCAHRIKGRNWMQAYSLWYAHEHRRFINSSAAGLGKTRTIPGVVSTFDIHLTVLFSPKKITNEDNPQLAQEMKAEDPAAVIHFSDRGVPTYLEPGKHHYFVCNSEKLQQGPKTKAMVDALIAHDPGLIVFDEGHLLVSSNLVDPEVGETEKDTKYKPRMEGLRYLLGKLAFDTRIIVLTGTPVRVDAREGQALFELVGEDVGEFSPEMSELNALRLRGRLQEFGFQFINHKLPTLRRYILPFRVPDDVAARLNNPGLSTLAKEKVRIEYALRDLYSLKGRVVINSESVDLPELDAIAIEDLASDEAEGGIDLSGLSHNRFPVVRLAYEPMERAVNPVFFTYFVDGPAATIAAFLDERGVKYRSCTGDSDDADLGAYLRDRDSCLIASSSWSTGVDGSQRVSNTLVTLGIPWHDSGHRQTIARIQRQGAVTPDGVPTTVVHEIIPVAINVAYDVKRLNKVYSRRSFTEVLSLGEIEGNDDSDELFAAVNSLMDKSESS